MSGGISGHISKGIVHTKVDKVLNHRSGNVFDKRQNFRNHLDNAHDWNSYLAMLQDQTVMGQDFLLSDEARYLRDHWYNDTDPDVWWQWLQPIYPILRRGLLKAIFTADIDPTTANPNNPRNPPLPIDSYWLPGGNQVAVLVTASPQQVTRLIITPPSPAPYARRHTRSDIWEIRRGHGEGHDNDEDQESQDNVDSKVYTWRRRDAP
jgi:hypothetical protein